MGPRCDLLICPLAEARGYCRGLRRAPKGDISIRIVENMNSGIPLILGPGTRMSDPYVYVVFWPPSQDLPILCFHIPSNSYSTRIPQVNLPQDDSGNCLGNVYYDPKPRAECLDPPPHLNRTETPLTTQTRGSSR